MKIALQLCSLEKSIGQRLPRFSTSITVMSPDRASTTTLLKTGTAASQRSAGQPPRSPDTSSLWLVFSKPVLLPGCEAVHLLVGLHLQPNLHEAGLTEALRLPAILGMHLSDVRIRDQEGNQGTASNLLIGHTHKFIYLVWKSTWQLNTDTCHSQAVSMLLVT